MIVGFINILIWFISFNTGFNNSVVKKEDPKCADCHKNIVEQAVVHPAMDDCSGCHQAGAQTHPAAGAKTFTLTQPVPALCNTCHEGAKKAQVHAPFDGGECLSCHTPHNSPNKSLVLNAPVSKLCETCHDLALTTVKNIHNPVKFGNCTGCHNPHQSDSKKLLKSNMPQLCFTCHEKTQKQSTEKNIHPPFESECSSCHKAHASNDEKLMVKKVPELCFDCHSDFSEKYDKLAVQHSPVKTKKACVNCHSPHASGESKYLLKKEKNLCLSCHSKQISIAKSGRIISDMNTLFKTAKSVHAAVEDGCSGCHNPHASANANLLKGNYSNELYATAKAENFALCFTCHDKELLEKENTNATGFRNGNKNMHYLHINENKGRSCKTCHNVHASTNLHLIKEKTMFGTWEMVLNYKSDAKGGSCATGCHREKRYERDNFFSNERKKIITTQKKTEPANLELSEKKQEVSKDFKLSAEEETQLKAEEETRAKADAQIKAKELEDLRIKIEETAKKKTELEAITKARSVVNKNKTADELAREDAIADSMIAVITIELTLELRLDSILSSKLPRNQVNEFKILKSLELLVDFNKTELVNGKEAELVFVIEFLKNYPERKVEIQGHTDNKGTPELNKEISLKRAEYVKNFIVKNGINPSQISVVGHGYSRPKDTNDTEEGRAKNRRIEFRLTE